MSSVNNLLNSGVSSVTGNSVATSALSRLSDKLDAIESDTSVSDEAKQKQVDKIKGQMATAASISGNISNAGNLINGMLGGRTDTVDFASFFGSDLSTMRLLLSSSSATQREARVLASEISLDKARGVDTSDKEEKLSNMTANTSILNKGLSGKIDSALADKTTDKDTRSEIDKINDELAANQKKLDAEFSKKYGNKWKDGAIVEDDGSDSDKKTEETKTDSSSAASTGSSSTSSKTPKPSVIDQINAGLRENQSKLDKEFSEKYGNTWKDGNIVEEDDNN